MGNTGVDDPSLGCLLLVSLSGAAGIRNYGAELRFAGHPNFVLLPRCNGCEPLCDRESAPHPALSRHGGEVGGDEPPARAGTSRGATVRAFGGIGPTVRRTGARGPQSPRGDQGIGGNVNAKTGR